MAIGKKRSKERAEKLFAAFKLEGQQILGELVLDGDRTNLHLSSRKPIPYNSQPHALFGESLDHRKLSLYDCVGYSPSAEGVYPNPVYYRDVFPHFALIGPRHHDWGDEVFTTVSFKSDDMGVLFASPGTFGWGFVSGADLQGVLPSGNSAGHSDYGDHPLIFWYANKHNERKIGLGGKILHAQMTFESSVSDFSGITCPSETAAVITYENPVGLGVIIDDISSLLDFVVAVTGRAQEVRDIRVTGNSESGSLSSEAADEFSLQWSLAPKSAESPGASQRDLPVSVTRNDAEFGIVLANWIQKHSDWSVARSRVLQWKGSGHQYDSNRLIAAANAFDVLPDSVYPAVGRLSDEVSRKRDRCKEIIMELAHGDERAQILSTLKFWGSALRDKVECRSKIVNDAVGSHLPGLNDVLRIALKARNFFVHGVDYGHKYFQELFEFLTDTLEFVFIASDLIECGWDARTWIESEPSYGNSMAGYVYSYRRNITIFRAASASARMKGKGE